MIFSSQNSNQSFKTKGWKKKWSPSLHSIGVIDIQSNNTLTLKCKKMAKDCVLDFQQIQLKRVK